MSAFVTEAAYAKWRDVVGDGGWWRRVVISRDRLEIAQAIAPHLKTDDLGPWSRAFLRGVWSACLDSVVIIAVEMLWTKNGVRNFKALQSELRARSRPETSRIEWDAYIGRVLNAALRTEVFNRGKQARDELIAHEKITPKRSGILMREVSDVQRLCEDVFVCFPAGESFHPVGIEARDYPEMVQRIIDGDNRPDT